MRRPFFNLAYATFPALLLGIAVGHRFSSPWHIVELQQQVDLLSHNVESYRHRRATEDRFGIRIAGAAEPFDAGDPSWSLHGEPLTQQQLLDALPGILTQLDRYPVAALKAAGLNRIVLCGTLAIRKRSEGGLADASTGTVYLAIPAWGAADPCILHALHHELYHLMDETVFPASSPDPEWSACNAKNFSYGNGGWDAPADQSSNVIDDRSPGFLTPYCKSAPEEDKAETFACMMAQPDAVAQRERHDPVVAEKVKLIRGRSTALCGELNDDFWKR